MHRIETLDTIPVKKAPGQTITKKVPSGINQRTQKMESTRTLVQRGHEGEALDGNLMLETRFSRPYLSMLDARVKLWKGLRTTNGSVTKRPSRACLTPCSDHQWKPENGHWVHRDDVYVGFAWLWDYKGGNGYGSKVHKMRPTRAQLIIVGLQEGPRFPQKIMTKCSIPSVQNVQQKPLQAEPAETLVFLCPWTAPVINLTT
ncbi:hypothetical protein LA080_013640 [Diaporthe eres]|nr:hypothetical protein LA080_013640 [Diaporthe eres]